MATDLHRERSDPDDNNKDKNPNTLGMEEFMEDIIQGWKEKKEVLGATPSIKVCDICACKNSTYIDKC